MIGAVNEDCVATPTEIRIESWSTGALIRIRGGLQVQEGTVRASEPYVTFANIRTAYATERAVPIISTISSSKLHCRVLCETKHNQSRKIAYDWIHLEKQAGWTARQTDTKVYYYGRRIGLS